LETDVLERLEKLQELADEIDRIEARRRSAAQEKERVEESLGKAERALAEKEERARAVDMERRKRELFLKGERERMARVKGRLGDVKTSREYQAVLAEIAAAKQNITDQESAQVGDMQELETVGTEIESLQGSIGEIRSQLEKADGDLQQIVSETDEKMVQHRQEEATLLKTLPSAVVDRYRLIRSRRGGLAVVPARDEACTACFMRIPPQLYIEVIRRSRVVQCPNCHRILVPPKPEAEAAQ
jgi:predicted  nucleic acid-binding Zn-ribbon protein